MNANHKSGKHLRQKLGEAQRMPLKYTVRICIHVSFGLHCMTTHPQSLYFKLVFQYSVSLSLSLSLSFLSLDLQTSKCFCYVFLISNNSLRVS